MRRSTATEHPSFEGHGLKILQAGDLVVGEGMLGELGVGRAPPQPKGCVEQVPRRLWSTRGQSILGGATPAVNRVASKWSSSTTRR
jgi:hypothetical protein